MSQELSKIRSNLALLDTNEHDLREEFPMVMTQWAKMQAIITKRNDEYQAAIVEITARYAEKIKEAEDEYAFYIKMASN